MSQNLSESTNEATSSIPLSLPDSSISRANLEPHEFTVDESECLFVSKSEFRDLKNNYAYLNEDNLATFIASIDTFKSLPTLFVHQNYFYQNPSDWCTFQDQLAELVTLLPSALPSLQRFYLKLDIHSPSAPNGFRAIQLNDNQLRSQRDLQNIFELLSSVLSSSFYLHSQQQYPSIHMQSPNPRNKKELEVHLILDTNSSVHTQPLFDSIVCIPNLKSLRVKLYYEEIPGDESQRSLLRHFFRRIGGGSASLESLGIHVHGKVQLIPAAGQSRSFAGEIKELTTAICKCNALRSLTLHLPIQFFFADFIVEKNLPLQESSIKRNLRALCKNKSIIFFDLMLVKEKHAHDLRRKTLQISQLQSFVTSQVKSSLKHLIQFKS